MEKNHFEQAKLWLEGAKYVSNRDESVRFAVAIAMLVHAIIKANDALTYKFTQATARKHDDARKLYEGLIKSNHIDAKYSNYNQIIQEAIINKSKAEYRGAYFSKADYESLLNKAEKFIKI